LYKKILLAVDESNNSSRAIEKVIDLQKSENCKVVMFHSIRHPSRPIIATLPSASGSGSFFINERELFNEYRKEGDSLLLARQKLFNNEDLPVEIRLIMDEAPEDYIERIVREQEFDLVVIGTKGVHSKLNQFILGSVAQRVVKQATCDVLIIR
jgi:nucleotide-binding universal stress UspA family protein